MEIRSNKEEIVDDRAQPIIATPPVVGEVAATPVVNVADVDGNRINPVVATPVAATPVAATPVAATPVVAAQAVAMPVGAETRVASRTTRFTPAALVAAIVAIGLLVLGGITAARAGVDSTLDEPVVTVAGFTATALLGLIEIAFGLLLLIAALAQARSVILFLGITGGVMALVAVFQPSVGEGSLALERGFAVFFAIVMAVIILTSLLPTLTSRNVVQHTTDV